MVDVLTRSLAETDPAVHTRGFGDEDLAEVADLIATTPGARFDVEVAASLRQRVAALADRVPLHPDPDADGAR